MDKFTALDREMARDAAFAIECAFAWTESAEGYRYWSDIANRLRRIARHGAVTQDAAD